MTTPVENDLRAELTRRADTVAVRSDPYGLVTRRVATNRRRRLVATAVTAALVLLAGILSAPMVTKLAGPDLSPAESPETWPARGELADDPGVRAYIDRVYEGGADEFRVLFAGDVGDRRYVVVRSPREPATVALVSPAGSFAVEGAGKILLEAPGQTAWAFVDRRRIDEPTTVFMLTAPGMDAAEYSVGPIVAEDGRVNRRWEQLERQDDGVFVGRAASDPSWQFRARAVEGRRVDVDVDADYLFSRAPSPSARLMAFAADATKDQPVPELAEALLDLEHYTLGPDAITAATVMWRDPRPWGGLYAGIALDTSGSGSIELVVNEEGDIMVARPVARGRAWATIPKPDTSWLVDGPKLSETFDTPSSEGDRPR